MSAASILCLKVTLDDVKPKVTRRLEVPADITLERLHLTLQAAFGWDNCHLFEISCGDLGWGIPQPEFGFDTLRDASKVRLGDVLQEFGARRLRYTYDFGDNWEHTIAVGKEIEPEPDVLYPRLVEAEGRCPPEDVGGPWGFADLREGLKDPNHAQHDDFVEWYGDADFDPENFNPELLKLDVMALAQRWSGKKARAGNPAASEASAAPTAATKSLAKKPRAAKAVAAKKARKAPAKEASTRKAGVKKAPARKLPAKKAAAKKRVPAGKKPVAKKKKPVAKKKASPKKGRRT
ncbi:MAG: plasmid pRiA4b ORF-3 family protein [Alphaproteobacteria bacterium]|nr:plasmid pRiA4b ORF-3 family protein [Alphaproteobacteria bacterium]